MLGISQLERTCRSTLGSSFNVRELQLLWTWSTTSLAFQYLIKTTPPAVQLNPGVSPSA